MNVSSSDRKWVPRILRCFGVVPPPHGFGAEMNREIIPHRGNEIETETDDYIVSSEPGIVARLMGLETLPSSEKIQIRSGTSVFCDYQEFYDDEFFILSFEHMDKFKRRKGVKKDFGSELRNKKSRKNDEEAENSSPSSVLEFADHESASSGLKSLNFCYSSFDCDFRKIESSESGEFPRLMNSKMRRMLSQQLESCGSSDNRTPPPVGIGRRMGLIGRNRGLCSASKWDEIRELAAAETVAPSHRNHVEEIGVEISSEILGLLLNEVLICLA